VARRAHVTGDFPRVASPPPKPEAITMTRRNLTPVASWLTALAAAATIPASAQPIDLLAPPSVTAPPSPPPLTPAPAAGPPVVTYALLPGHWQLQGAQYVWVLPDTVPRPVVSGRLVQGHYVWRAGEWIWVPAHFE
jgi:hypothetical protein